MTSIPCADEPNLADEPGLAHAFRVVLVALLTSSLAVSAFTLFLRWPLIPQLTLVAAASCLIALVLSRSGRVRPAMLLALLGIAYTVLHAAVRFDGMQSIGLSILPFLIVLCALLLTRLMIVFFTVGVILTVLGMLATRYFVLRVERYSTNDMGDLFIFALTCATAALVGRLLAVRIEEALGLVRDSESRYRRIFENVQDVYYEMRTDGILLELSPASAALFGVPREGMIGSALAPFCVNRSEFDALLAAVRTSGQVSNRELVLRDSRAAPRHVLVNASLRTGFQLGEKRVIGSIREITETKLAEQARRESERRFRELLEGVQLVAVMTDLDGTISFCNDYTLAITGWRKEEIIGRPAKDLLNPQTPPQVTDGMVIVPPGSQTQPFFEGSILEKNGGRRWIQWCSTPLRDSAGRAAGFASLGEDVTELRILRAEAARRESEARFQNMADTAPVMIWMAGTDKLCTFVNKGWLDFTGRSMEQELGNGWASGVDPEDLDRCLATYSSSFVARRTFQIEYRLRRADGEYRWVLDSGVPLYREDVFAGYIGSCIDITDQRRAEAVSRRSLDEITHLNRVAAMGELTGSLAHELNQPLAAILSNAQAAGRFLGHESPDLAQVRECLADIVADDKRAGEVIRRLRGLLKKEASQPSSVDLNEVVSDAIRLLGNDAMLRNVSVKFEPFRGLPPVLGDRIQLYQVALNLIVNGLDAVAERPPGHRWVLVRTAGADGGVVELTVEDSGKGIAEGDLARMFEPFFSTKREGLGMGLSISRSIVLAHGGRIWAENGAGRGAIFHCMLPVAQQGAVASAK